MSSWWLNEGSSFLFHWTKVFIRLQTFFLGSYNGMMWSASLFEDTFGFQTITLVKGMDLYEYFKKVPGLTLPGDLGEEVAFPTVTSLSPTPKIENKSPCSWRYSLSVASVIGHFQFLPSWWNINFLLIIKEI